MKILLISFGCRTSDGRLKELIKACQMIAETAVISCSNNENDGDKFTFIKGGRFDYLRFIYFCMKTARFLGNAELVFADNRAAIIPAMLCKKLLRSKYAVYDARELYAFKEIRHFRGKLGCMVEKVWMKRFDLVTCANSFRAKLMKKRFRLKDEPVVFENIRRLESGGPDAPANTAGIESLVDRSKVNIISTSGCLLERKCDILARAICELGEDYRLYLVGFPDINGKKAVERILEEYGANNVVFIDWLSKSELKRLIRQCDIGVVSYGNGSMNEKYCASGKIYEYLFEGLPVVTTGNPPLKEMCEKHGIGEADDGFFNGIRQIRRNLGFYKYNVYKFISDVDPDKNNKNLADEICLRLGIAIDSAGTTSEPCSERSVDDDTANL